MAYTRVGIVTGANKGIGYAIGTSSPYNPLNSENLPLTRHLVRQLALQYPTSPLNTGSLLVYLTARDASRGEDAVNNLHEDEQLKKAKALASDGGLTDIKFRHLDIADQESISAFGDFLKTEHPDGIDFVINNAGAAFNGFGMFASSQSL